MVKSGAGLPTTAGVLFTIGNPSRPISTLLFASFKNVLPTNNAYTKNNTNDITPLTNDFLLQQQINSNENELSINLSKKLSKKLSTKFTSKHKYVTYNYGLIDSKTKKTELLWLPSFQITWQPTNKQALSLSGSLNSVLPTLDQLNRAMIFTTINTISSGANAANIQRGYNASVFYLFNVCLVTCCAIY